MLSLVFTDVGQASKLAAAFRRARPAGLDPNAGGTSGRLLMPNVSDCPPTPHGPGVGWWNQGATMRQAGDALGTPTSTLQHVPGAGPLGAVACPSTTSCEAVGYS